MHLQPGVTFTLKTRSAGHSIFGPYQKPESRTFQVSRIVNDEIECKEVFVKSANGNTGPR